MTGLFFGSFNPIHTGHLIIAEYLYEHADLDEVWFIVSPQNPLKEQSLLIKDELRLQMVKLAIKDNRNFVASDVEFKLPKPSYTVNTLELLSKKYPRKKFALIMGSDNLEILHKWKDYQKILSTYMLLIFRRSFVEEADWKQYPGVIFFDTPLLKISSTLIRTLNGDKKSIRYLVPEKVREFIMKKKLYKRKKS
ncbi:MAG: nicotinate (nicotinamide) nucleotide adenylyltransferase [Chitinophagales bacterium]